MSLTTPPRGASSSPPGSEHSSVGDVVGSSRQDVATTLAWGSVQRKKVTPPLGLKGSPRPLPKPTWIQSAGIAALPIIASKDFGSFQEDKSLSGRSSRLSGR